MDCRHYNSNPSMEGLALFVSWRALCLAAPMSSQIASELQMHVNYVKSYIGLGFSVEDAAQAIVKAFDNIIDQIAKTSALSRPDAIEILTQLRDTPFDADQRGQLARLINSKVGSTGQSHSKKGTKRDRQQLQEFYNLHKCLTQQHWDFICDPGRMWKSNVQLWTGLLSDVGISNPAEKMYTYIIGLQVLALCRGDTITIDPQDFYSKICDLKQAMAFNKDHKMEHHGQVISNQNLGVPPHIGKHILP